LQNDLSGEGKVLPVSEEVVVDVGSHARITARRRSRPIDFGRVTAAATTIAPPVGLAFGSMKCVPEMCRSRSSGAALPGCGEAWPQHDQLIVSGEILRGERQAAAIEIARSGERGTRVAGA
jgi:hypothetical protein